VSPTSILIAGGEGEGKAILKDVYTLDTSNNTLQRQADIPQVDAFASPSTLVIHKHHHVLGWENKTIYKFSIESKKWENVYSFK